MSHDHDHHHRPAASPFGMAISRRAALAGLGAVFTLAGLRPAWAGVPFPQRLVILNIRGGLDGMSAVVPYGDASLAGLRAPLIPPPVGQSGGMFDLGGFYGLNPSLPNLYALYKQNQMLAVHAVGNLLLTRSHFAAQDAIELGQVGGSTGWMNRLIGLLQTTGGGVEAGVSFGAGAPAVAQGPALTGGWAQSPWPAAPDTLAALIETLGAADPLIGPPTQSGFNDRLSFKTWLAANTAPPGKSPLQSTLRAAGVFLAAAGGPAVTVIEATSVDSHINQLALLQSTLSDLDTGIGLLASAMGSAWANTVVMTMTEFGRRAAMNGCGGTDHGTGFAMFLAGGAVNGGRVIANPWPGLTTAQLYQGIDLQPTTDVRSVIMGVLRDHMGLSANALATVFPNATGISPMGGLVNG